MHIGHIKSSISLLVTLSPIRTTLHSSIPSHGCSIKRTCTDFKGEATSSVSSFPLCNGGDREEASAYPITSTSTTYYCILLSTVQRSQRLVTSTPLSKWSVRTYATEATRQRREINHTRTQVISKQNNACKQTPFKTASNSHSQPDNQASKQEDKKTTCMNGSMDKHKKETHFTFTLRVFPQNATFYQASPPCHLLNSSFVGLPLPPFFPLPFPLLSVFVFQHYSE